MGRVGGKRVGKGAYPSFFYSKGYVGAPPRGQKGKTRGTGRKR